MSMNVAVIAASGEVVAINVQPDDYEPAPHEVIVTGTAWVGGTYVGGNFYPPQPYPSWSLDGNHDWQPPTPMPAEGGPWVWDEATLSWVALT